MDSKSLNLQDYAYLDIQHLDNIHSILSGVNYRMEHPHRRWEYGIALKVIRENKIKTILDVGGGGSILAPTLAWLDYEVTEVDPGDVGFWIEAQTKRINKPIYFIQQDYFAYEKTQYFDAVICISVIEHIEEDEKFFLELLKPLESGGLLILTTDFHPDGTAKVPGHLRTYNRTQLLWLASLAHDFKWYSQHDYFHFDEYVNNYSFASMILVKK